MRPPVPGKAGGPASGSLAADRVVASGWQVHDNKGRVVEKYEPFFADGWAYQPELEAKRGRHLAMTYDPRGQLVRTVHTDGSEQRVILGVPGVLANPDVAKPEEFEPTPWESYTYDTNDLDGLRAAPPSAPTARPALLGHRHTPASRLLDALGRAICQIQRNGPSAAQDWFLTRSSYDLRGNLLTVTDPLGRTAFRHSYDLGNRALRIESIDAGVRTSVPDALGNLAEYRDSKGSIVLREYDRLARLTRVWARDQPAQPLTLRERIEHGDGGDPAQPAADRSANRALNRLGRPATHYDEAGRVSFERYDFTGNLLEKVRHVVNDAAIARGYVANWSAANAEADLEPGTEYRTGTRYDALGRPVEVTYPCEAKPRNPSILLPTRAVTTARYNRAGAVESVQLDGREFVAHIAYNARAQRLLIAYGNGLMTRYAYDPDTFRLARLRTERFTRPPGSLTWTGQDAPLQDWTYAYDPAGNIVAIEEHIPGCGVAEPGGDRNSVIRNFAYDPLYRLTSATGRACKSAATSRPLGDIAACGSGQYGPPYRPGPPTPNQDNAPDHTERYTETYAYDPAGNLLKLTYQPEPPGPKPPHWSRKFGLGSKAPGQWRDAPDNRLTELRMGSAPPHTYAYDDNGNLRQQNLERFHTWDHADRMIGYRTQHGSTPSVDARYLYAADGTRVKTWVRYNASSVPETTVYIDGVFEFHQWREEGKTKQQNHLHVMDNQSRIAIARVGDRSNADAGPPVQYHLGDHLGSSTLIVRDDAAWINREEYTPYGETSFGSYSRKRYRFGGRERDDHSGLSYHGARYYAPWLCRWTACDPAGLTGGANLYAAFRCSPFVFCDPGGLQNEKASESGVGINLSSQRVSANFGIQHSSPPFILDIYTGPSQSQMDDLYRAYLSRPMIDVDEVPTMRAETSPRWELDERAYEYEQFMAFRKDVYSEATLEQYRWASGSEEFAETDAVRWLYKFDLGLEPPGETFGREFHIGSGKPGRSPINDAPSGRYQDVCVPAVAAAIANRELPRERGELFTVTMMETRVGGLEVGRGDFERQMTSASVARSYIEDATGLVGTKTPILSPKAPPGSYAFVHRFEGREGHVDFAWKTSDGRCFLWNAKAGGKAELIRPDSLFKIGTQTFFFHKP